MNAKKHLSKLTAKTASHTQYFWKCASVKLRRKQKKSVIWYPIVPQAIRPVTFNSTVHWVQQSGQALATLYSLYGIFSR